MTACPTDATGVFRALRAPGYYMVNAMMVLFTMPEVRTLSEAVATSQIEELQIWHCDFNADKMAVLAGGIKRAPNIKALSFRGNKMGPAAGPIFADLIMTTGINDVRIVNENLGDEGCLALADAVRNKPTTTPLSITFNNNGTTRKCHEAMAAAIMASKAAVQVDFGDSVNSGIPEEDVELIKNARAKRSP